MLYLVEVHLEDYTFRISCPSNRDLALIMRYSCHAACSESFAIVSCNFSAICHSIDNHRYFFFFFSRYLGNLTRFLWCHFWPWLGYVNIFFFHNSASSTFQSLFCLPSPRYGLIFFPSVFCLPSIGYCMFFFKNLGYRLVYF